MSHQFPSPSINPLKRLHVYDSLMMNAERWLLAQEYQRRRQNIHYQSLNQPGIVCGLGVRSIDPPDSADARFRDRRWIEIQPGIAIDVEGNPIVVDESIDRTYRIAAKAPTSGTLTVYVVISYVEPENPKNGQARQTIPEQFRFDQITSPPSAREIELCRIRLQPGSVQLEAPRDVLFPGVNQLDFRYRIPARARPQAVVSVAQLQQSRQGAESLAPGWYGDKTDTQSHRTRENLSYLMESVATLYPALQGSATVEEVTLQHEVAASDLLYLTDAQVLNLSEAELDTLNQYLQTGGVMLIESLTDNAIPIESVKTSIAQQLETPLASWQELSRNHLLRTQPFLFAAPPFINQQFIKLWHGGGIILVAGELSADWGVNDEFLPRDDIRTAQELGINILHFAWQRRQLTQLSQ